MRLYELLNEAISLTHLRQPLIEAINEQLIYCTTQMGYKEKLVPADVREKAIKDVSLSGINKVMTPVLFEMMKQMVAHAIEDTIRKDTHIPCSVEFQKLKTGGHASGLDIVINSDVIQSLAEDMLEKVYQVTIDSLDSEENLVPTFFKICRTISEYISRRGLDRDVERNVENLVSVAIHELVHVVQHNQQFKKGRYSTEYRSYLSKNSKDFYSSINKIHNSEHNDKDYRLYRGSPQEIAAFAHEAALKFIKDIDIEYIEEYKKDLPRELEHYIERMFNDPKNAEEYKVFKRFNKLMYQEVVRYIEHIEKKKAQVAQ